MSERGLVGVAALWVMVAASSLALALMSLAQWNQSHSRNQVQEIKMVFLAQEAALLEAETGFKSSVRNYEFVTGQVLIERVFKESKKEVRLLCDVKTGKNEKEIEMGWEQIGGQWRAVYWREL